MRGDHLLKKINIINHAHLAQSERSVMIINNIKDIVCKLNLFINTLNEIKNNLPNNRVVSSTNNLSTTELNNAGYERTSFQ